jgi:hypothetical protein
MAKEFCWNTYYLKKTERVKKIDVRLERLKKEAKKLMTERIALVREGFPDG